MKLMKPWQVALIVAAAITAAIALAALLGPIDGSALE